MRFGRRTRRYEGVCDAAYDISTRNMRATMSRETHACVVFLNSSFDYHPSEMQ